MTVGTGQRRARNKAARLPREYRRLLIGMLLDAEDYQDIADAIAEAGCPADACPSRRAIATYHAGPEFGRVQRDWLDAEQRSAERAALASAIADDGIEGAADMVTFEALDRMLTMLRDPDSEADPAELGRLAVAVKKAAADAERRKLEAELATLRSRLTEATASGQRTGDPAAAMAVLDDYLRGGAR